jgi:hypothetical protein
MGMHRKSQKQLKMACQEKPNWIEIVALDRSRASYFEALHTI